MIPHLITPACGVAALTFVAALAAAPSLDKLWVSEAVFDVPESVFFDAARSVLYVSNLASGPSWEDKGNGSIGKLALDGSVIDAAWVTGLNAPKGMGLIGRTLYVTDNDDIVSIDVETGEILERFHVEGSENLNDLSAASNGAIYFTDSKVGNVYSLNNGVVTPLVTGLKGLNGVLQSEGELLFVDSGGLYLYSEDGSHQQIAAGMEGFTDGIERIDADAWLVSCWKGTVYHVTRGGEVTLLLDGRPTETSAADLGYDPVRRIAYFPGFHRNFVAAYRLE